MSNISIVELYELYLDTVGRCTSDLKSRTDEDILYDLFEEFDTGAWSFMHEGSLTKLRGTGYIDDEILEISKEVRKRWLALQSKPCTVEDIRTKKEWQELFNLCDRIKEKLGKDETSL